MGRAVRVSSITQTFLCICLFAVPPAAWAAPKAWLINVEGEAVKLDLTQNVIVETKDLGLDRIFISDVAVDRFRGNVLVPDGRGPYTVSVLDLRTLNDKGTLDFEVDRAVTGDAETIRFVFPPTGGEFFARWWNDAAAGGTGTFEIATIDATTFQTTARRTSSPALANRLMLDASGRQLYSMTDMLVTQKPARIDVFDVPSFARTSTIDLEALLNPLAFGRGIHDFGLGKILITENEKASRPEANRYTLFVLEVATGRTSPKIQTGMMGDARLLPRTNRVLFDERTTTQPGAILQSPSNVLSPGRVHVYDTVTGNRQGIVQINLDPGEGSGKILGVSPAEDAFYYLIPRARDATLNLGVVSLTNLSVVREVRLPMNEPKMFIFDE